MPHRSSAGERSNAGCRGVVALLLLAVCALTGAPGHALEAGSAKVEITPPLGTPLNGYGDRMARGATSVHDPLWARCVFLDDGETKVLLVNADLCMINAELRARVLELAPADVPRENVILTATHTHNAQGAMHRYLPLRFVAGRYSQEVLELTAQGIAAAMRGAVDARKRAAIGYGSFEQDNLSRNRREENGPIDPQVGVIRVDDADGNEIAIIANFAAHPTSVPENQRFAISADYCGYYYQELESISPPGCVALFMNGAEGNQTIGDANNTGGDFGRPEGIGRLLATRVKTASNEIDCGEATLRVATATPQLPPTLAHHFLPDTVFLQTLEINDLLLCFFPGEPVVELGLELRRQALARGYRAQFSVGLANDYLLYFIPRAFYAQPTYEAGQNYYGPRIAEWFYTEFSRLMSKGEPPADAPSFDVAAGEPFAGGERTVLSGDAYERGYRRGARYSEDIRRIFQERVEQPVLAGGNLPETGLWAFYPSFLDPTPLALPMMAIAARPMLNGVSDEAFSVLEGLAAGAGLPFDAVWLLQNARTFSLRQDKTPLFRAPLCTMFAVGPERSDDGSLLIGRNLDWAHADAPVITEVRPDRGRSYVNVGFQWNEGVYSGMNDAGLVLCLEWVEGLGFPGMEQAPIEMTLRDILQAAGTFEEAVALLQAQTHVHGYHVLVAGPGAEAWQAAIIEYGEAPVVRSLAEPALLPGIDPASFRGSENDRRRYARLLEITPVTPLAPEMLQRLLADTDGAGVPGAAIWNEHTRHSIVFEPQRRRLHVSFRQENGLPGEYAIYSLTRGAAANE